MHKASRTPLGEPHAVQVLQFPAVLTGGGDTHTAAAEKFAFNAATAGVQAAALLNQQNADGFVDLLASMRDAGIWTLDLSGQTLSNEAVACLARVLHDRPAILGEQLTAFDLRNARLDITWPLLDVLKGHGCAIVESLDFSGTLVLDDDGSGQPRYRPLQEADLHRIADVVAHCPRLRDLKLNQQPGLSSATHCRLKDKALHQQAPMFVLASTLHRSQVQTLELRDCELWPVDVNWLDPLALGENGDDRPHGSGLRSIDLQGNHDMFVELTSPVLRSRFLVELVMGYNRQGCLQALFLPSNALAMVGNNAGATALCSLLQQPGFRGLLSFEPFSSSTEQRFAPLRQVLMVNAMSIEEKPSAVPVDIVVALPVEDPVKESIDEAVIEPATQDEPLIEAKQAREQMALYLNQESVDGVVTLLGRMRRAGIKTIDLEKQTLSVAGVACLVKVQQEQPSLLVDHITGFSFHATKLDIETLSPLLDVLKLHRYKGGVIQSLDFGYTQLKSRDGNGMLWLTDFSVADLNGIVALIKQCPSLRTLNLSCQKKLSFRASPQTEAPSTPIAQQRPMLALTDVLGISGVEMISLVSCALHGEDIQLLNACAERRQPGSGLREIRLEYNDPLHKDPSASSQTMIEWMKGAFKNPDLHELYLPYEILSLLDDDEAASALTQALEESKNSSISWLAPFSFASSVRFAKLQQILKANKDRQRKKT